MCRCLDNDFNIAKTKASRARKIRRNKKRYQFMLTETASDKVDELAEKFGITRSELLERLMRSDCLKAIEAEQDEA